MHRTLALSLAALVAASSSLAPHPAGAERDAAPHGSCAPGGGVLLDVALEDAGAGRTRVVLEASATLDVVDLDTQLALPDGGLLRHVDLPRATALAAGARTSGSALVERPGGAATLAVVRATYGLVQPDGSVELLGEEHLVHLGGRAALAGVRRVASALGASLDVPAAHAPAGRGR